MNKKFLLMLTALSFALILAACGANGDTIDKKEAMEPVTEGNTSSVIEEKNPADSINENKYEDTKNAVKEDLETTEESTSQAAANPSRPSLIEVRLYVSEGNHSWNYYIQIFDNGGWEISQQNGNMEVYAGYSYEEEAAGAYVTVQGYNLATDPPTNIFIGNARFTMTEEEFSVLFDNADEPNVFVRYSLDEPLY